MRLSKRRHVEWISCAAAAPCFRRRSPIEDVQNVGEPKRKSAAGRDVHFIADLVRYQARDDVPDKTDHDMEDGVASRSNGNCVYSYSESAHLRVALAPDVDGRCCTLTASLASSMYGSGLPETFEQMRLRGKACNGSFVGAR